jgi:hypothetical protein
MSVFAKEWNKRQPKSEVKATFVNEIGNHINISTSVQYPKHEKYVEVRVVTEGPHSVSDNTWTLEEAKLIRQQLNQILSQIP